MLSSRKLVTNRCNEVTISAAVGCLSFSSKMSNHERPGAWVGMGASGANGSAPPKFASGPPSSRKSFRNRTVRTALGITRAAAH